LHKMLRKKSNLKITGKFVSGSFVFWNLHNHEYWYKNISETVISDFYCCLCCVVITILQRQGR
jgi:hypothetical protein